jgi:ADP-heptose:LPS heptosyltransferase
VKIAILRALQLGDLLCAVPALRALRVEFPTARITLVGLPWAREFVARFRRYLFDFLEFPGFPGLSERRASEGAIAGFFEQVQARKYDLVLQMHGSGEITNGIALVMGGRHTAGFYRSVCPDRQRFLPWRDEEHEVLRYLRLLAHLGIEARGEALEFPLGDADWRDWDALGLERGGYAVVHAGSQLASRRWPPQRFAEVADALAAGGLQVVLTGTAREFDLTRQVRNFMRAPALDLAGLTSLGGLGVLVARARLVVANDTGVSHIAAALRTPSVIVASGSDPRRWAPLDHRRHHVLHYAVPCRPCVHAVCPIGHPCALGIEAGQVIDEARKLAACAA